MKALYLNLFYFFALSLISASTFAQQDYQFIKNVPVLRSWTINFSEQNNDLQISAMKKREVAPEPLNNSAAIKKQLNEQRQRKYRKLYKTSPYETRPEDINPEIANNFNGKPFGVAGIPNDNTMAISNNGIIISAINTTVTILDEQGEMLKFRTLAGIVGGQLGLLDRYYDPKVIYDPVADRFILVFLEGSSSEDTRIILGFTLSNDPTADWKFYQINGRPLGGETWSDYPIIAHNKEDLFITVNLLKDDGSWQEGFLQSFIWQINKSDGYTGTDSIRQNLYYDIKHQNKSLWSICPVQPAEGFDQTNMYFLSVRPDAQANDTVFLHEITHSLSSGQAQHKLKILRSDLKYGVPPSAFQPEEGYALQTNDTRVLSATLFNGNIHFVSSTLVPAYLSSGIYHGIVSNPDLSPEITGHIIGSDTLDYAYPSITYSGTNSDKSPAMAITFSHVGELDYPGTSAIFYNQLGDLSGLYSKVIKIREGDDLIDTWIEDNTTERWGDYTDIQRKYNEEGVVWLCGSYGDADANNNVWIAKLKVNNMLKVVDQVITYPNPAHHSVHIAANFEQEDEVDLLLNDVKGALVQELSSQQVKPGAVDFLLNTSGLHSGMYFLRIISQEGEVLYTQKVVVQ